MTSERPNHLKLSSAEPRSFGQIHRSFGRSFGRISGQKIRKNEQFFSSKNYVGTFGKDRFSKNTN